MAIDLSKTRANKINEIVYIAVGEAMNKHFPILAQENMLLAADACMALAFTYSLQCIAKDPENPTLQEISTVKDSMVNMIMSARPKRIVEGVT